ncbi:3-hydroxyisobutyrate dehydrogenase [Aureococcus anophagefferens]|nr:3-hydroxyisobutyrate dehydrogenase [Aureococcus anophagefferens]
MEAAAPPPADAPEPAAKRQKVDASALPTLKPWKTNVSVAVASHAGKRAAMEDAHCVVHADQFAALIAEAGGDVPAGARVALYGVLDGHNGKRVAELCCRRLPAHVARELALLLRQQARQPAKAVSDKAPVHCWHSKKRVEAALRRACARVEADAAASGFDAEGCCCVAALLVQDECHVLNLGDSRAVLVRRGDEALESRDRCGGDAGGPQGASAAHRSKFPWELGARDGFRRRRRRGPGADDGPPRVRARRAASPTRAAPPTPWKRRGMMEVSRTFGDAAIKRLCGRPQADATKNAISAEPDVRVKLTLDSARDELLFLACDGLWTRFNPVDAATFLRTRLLADFAYSADGNRRAWGDLDKAARALVDDAVRTATARTPSSRSGSPRDDAASDAAATS